MTKRKWTLFKSRAEIFFERVQRTNAKKNTWITVVKTEDLSNFIAFIINAPQLTDDYKLMIAIQLTTGSRVSELLNLKKKDFKFKDGKAIALIDVLKKRDREVIRYGLIATAVISLLQDKLNTLSDDEKLFKKSRTAVWMQYKEMLGMTPHALRHSWVNYLFEQKNRTTEQVVNDMAFSTWEMANKYYNTNPEKSAWKLSEEDDWEVS